MTDEELEELLVSLESDRVERKESIGAKDRICQAICAFANDLPGHREPGVVFVGARDDGSSAGVPVTDQLLLTLADLRSNGNIQPFPVMSVEPRVVRGARLAVVVVQPSDSPPVRYRGQAWIRVGPRRALASAEEERRLTERRRAGDLPFDIRPVPSSTLGDLGLDLFRDEYLAAAVARDVLAQNERALDQQLAALRLTTPDGTPTTLGLLVLGTEPTRFLPGAYVQFLRFDGTELTEPIKDEKRVEGPLPQVLRQVEEILQVNIAVAVDLTTGATERRSPDYPLVALQQIVRNAVMHRSYEGTAAPVRITWFTDRVEVQSPGGPFGQVTVEGFGSGVTDYRNPNLADAMRVLGYVQRFGVGIAAARKALVDNGNPPLELEPVASHVLAILRGRA